MKKFGWLLIASFVFAFPGLASAHTGMESSSPAKDQIIAQEVNEITMTFNTEIEPLSSFELTDEQGNGYVANNIKTENSQMSGTLEPSLTNGAYTVNWKIIGRDGHPITGSFDFQVQIPETAPSPSVEPTTQEAETLPQATDQARESPNSEPLEDEMTFPSESTLPSETPNVTEVSEEPTKNTSITAGLIFALLAAFLIVAFLIIRKKRK